MAQRADSRRQRNTMLLRLPAFIFICAAAASVSMAQGQSALASGDPLVEARETRAWLTRIQEAARKRNFGHGRRGAVAPWQHRLAHYWKVVTIRALDLSTAGAPSFAQRSGSHGMDAAPRAVVEQRRPYVLSVCCGWQRPRAGVLRLNPGQERVAGHEATCACSSRATSCARLSPWAEKNTCFLLRAEVLGDRGEVLESSAFSEVSIGVKPQLDSVTQPVKKLDGFRMIKPMLVPTRMEAEGWALKTAVPGFQMVSCVKRQFDAPSRNASAATSAPAAQALQTVYSDGLTYVSIFIEPYNAERHVRPMFTTIGATHTTMRREGDWWVT